MEVYLTLYTFFTYWKRGLETRSLFFYPASNLPIEGKMNPSSKHRNHLTIFRSQEVGMYDNFIIIVLCVILILR